MSALPVDPIDAHAFSALADFLDLHAERYAWRTYGACRQHPEVNFFPSQGGATAPAKAICAGCPVREACLEAALANGETHGIWGGTSERERRRLRRERVVEPGPRRIGGRKTAAEQVLEFLGRQPGGSFYGSGRALADAMRWDGSPTQVTNAVANLEALGVVVVDPPGPRGKATGRAGIRSVTLAEAAS